MFDCACVCDYSAASKPTSGRDSPVAAEDKGKPPVHPAIKRAATMNHGKSASLDVADRSRDDNGIVSFDATALAVCVLSTEHRRALGAAIAKNPNVLQKLDKGGSGTVRRPDALKVLTAACSSVPADVIGDVLDCFDFLQDGNVKHSAVIELLSSQPEVMLFAVSQIVLMIVIEL